MADKIKFYIVFAGKTQGIPYKMKRTKTFAKAFEHYANKYNLRPPYHFEYNGNRVEATDTPAGLEMIWGNGLVCHAIFDEDESVVGT